MVSRAHPIARALPVLFALYFSVVLGSLAIAAPAVATATEEIDGETPCPPPADSINESCPEIRVQKIADADAIAAGDLASFHILIWNEGQATASNVDFRDSVPQGLDWSFDIVSDHEAASCESSSDPDGTIGISCRFRELEPSSMEAGIDIHVFASTDREDCGLLVNTASVDADNHDEVSSTDEITVSCPTPTLVIDKVADTDLITITGPNQELVASPAVVTWTLTYVMTNGPVSNAIIRDALPAGFVFLDASDGGTLVDGTVTWTFATLAESGSVTFRTAVDPETISRIAPTVNVAVIESDDTAEDESQDSVSVSVEPPPLGGTPAPSPRADNPSPTPKPSLPNTAVVIDADADRLPPPIEVFGASLIALGALALTKLRTPTRRQ
jgi:uncharacterized repeat protein (TIGR01451 family)